MIIIHAECSTNTNTNSRRLVGGCVPNTSAYNQGQMRDEIPRDPVVVVVVVVLLPEA